ncbi:hypothetical protein [Zavarzinia sp. CC-PAN008]|uniref:hypothetical protein n=1 Tax=Zavarzinia sp. CC-PAN008 TaxID=3243332 RepID=UPI003F744717
MLRAVTQHLLDVVPAVERPSVRMALEHLQAWHGGLLRLPRPILYVYWEALAVAPRDAAQATLLRKVTALEYEFASDFGYVVARPTPASDDPAHPLRRALRHRPGGSL